MKQYKKYIYFSIFSLCFTIFFSFNITAINKAIYPNTKSLQPISDETISNIGENMNSEQAQNIKNLLNDSGQTIDPIKLEKVAMEGDYEFVEKIKKSNISLWFFILFLIFIFGFILGIRFFQKDKK